MFKNLEQNEKHQPSQKTSPKVFETLLYTTAAGESKGLIFIVQNTSM